MNDAVAREVVLEPKTGGRLYEIAHDGDEIEWGSVAQFVEGERLVLNWHINAPAEQATEVTVHFAANADGGTDVILIHSQFEKLAENGAQMRDGYNKGWVNVFENHFAQACG